MGDADLIAKVLVLGDSAVGKTNLLLRFCDGDYKPNYLATMGIDFKSKLVSLDKISMRLQLWDTAGQDRFRTITQSYYKGAAGVVLVYSVTDRKSF
jgi:small GTP-binding protein